MRTLAARLTMHLPTSEACVLKRSSFLQFTRSRKPARRVAASLLQAWCSAPRRSLRVRCIRAINSPALGAKTTVCDAIQPTRYHVLTTALSRLSAGSRAGSACSCGDENDQLFRTTPTSMLAANCPSSRPRDTRPLEARARGRTGSLCTIEFGPFVRSR